MCVIAVSQKGVKQPSLTQLKTCFLHNPHGAGYMVVRNGMVEIHKGFMTWKEFSEAVKQERFTKDDVVVYHFRIATQGGINPEKTHPFPLAKSYEKLEAYDLICPIGLAHNGIIRMTSGAIESYSDTQIFISEYMTRLIREPEDITDPSVIDMIKVLTGSKWAILDGATQNVVTVGEFYRDIDGILFSNNSYKATIF